ncbi:MAG: hypothetical protein AAGH72_08575 [Verrucomicrobiota bacterium]
MAARQPVSLDVEADLILSCDGYQAHLYTQDGLIFLKISSIFFLWKMKSVHRVISRIKAIFPAYSLEINPDIVVMLKERSLARIILSRGGWHVKFTPLKFLLKERAA